MSLRYDWGYKPLQIKQHIYIVRIKDMCAQYGAVDSHVDVPLNC